jgi:hypothetical protein
MQQPSADDKTIVFVSEAIENIQTVIGHAKPIRS